MRRTPTLSKILLMNEKKWMRMCEMLMMLMMMMMFVLMMMKTLWIMVDC